jgi:aryl-alcohol dehydrogenase-like predicted oxidoreductase
MGDGPNDERLSAVHVRRACEESLRRLSTDHIDLYQMHHVWREVTWDELWPAMERLVQRGDVVYVGSSNFAGWHLAQANEAAKTRGLLGLVSEQSLYNLTERTVELEVIPACRAYGLGLLPWSPLAGGLLAGGAGRGTGRRAEEGTRDRARHLADALSRWESLCREAGEEPAVMALAWLLSREGVTAPIIGPRTVEQLESALRALEVKLDDATLAKIDAIFPGPGGPAPEAYAW